MPRLRHFLVLLPIALLAASCSSADTLAAVNEIEITKDEVTALRPSYAEPTNIEAEQLRQDLSLLIIVETLEDAAWTQYGYATSEAEIADRISNPPERYETVIAPPEQFQDVTADAIRVSAIQSLIRDAVVPELAEQEAGGFDALIATRPEEVTRSCVRHISTATEDEAEVVLDRLQAGEDFAVVAAVSLDQESPGGLLANTEGDCLVWLTRAGVDFSRLAATAPLNVPVGPVEAGEEWSVLVVEERIAPASAAELAADPMEYFDPDYISGLYNAWLNDAVQVAEIEISPTVGRWSETGIGIAPPGE